MNKQPATKTATPWMSSESLMTAALGWMMGQIVLALSSHHGGSALGLVIAMVFVVSGGASLTLFLTHRHLVQRPRTERPPVQTWLLALGTALLLSVHFGSV